MTNKEIFQKTDFHIPVKQMEEDFSRFQNEIFDRFFENINSFSNELKDNINPIKLQIERLAEAIIKSINHYLNGDTIEAYRIFTQALTDVQKKLLSIEEGVANSAGIYEEFYRARIGDDLLYTREEMFHIPFEKRHLVSSQRYSLPGIPCLYLANSTYLCWEELGKPDFHKVQYSRFDLSKAKLRLLNLSHTSQAISHFAFDDTNGNLLETYDLLVTQFLATWPLQAAVSNIVKHRDAPFKPEYIIPQLLLQWIVNNKELDGVSFFSTKSNGGAPVLHFGNLSNIVIPIKQSKEKGLCEKLSQSIPLTNPVSYEYISLMQPQLSSEKLSEKEMKLSMKPATLKLHKDLIYEYENTKFGQLERVLKGLDCKLIRE